MKLSGRSRLALLAGVPLTAFAIAAIVMARGNSGDSNKPAAVVAAPTLAVAVTDRQPLPTQTALAQPTAVPVLPSTAALAQPTAVPVLPTTAPAVAAPLPDRSDCAAIRAAPDYRSGAERDWFQQNCIVVAAPAVAAAAQPAPAAVAAATTNSTSIFESPYDDSPVYGTPDRLVIKRLGMDAPVNERKVGPDGGMGDPVGPTDVIWYDFSNWRGYGGYPGSGGNSVIAGHVDYHNYGLAVFAPLRNIQVGDIIEYDRGDGQVVTFSVIWYTDVPLDDEFNAYIVADQTETLTLITCNGTFDYGTHEYDEHRVVRAVRVS